MKKLIIFFFDFKKSYFFLNFLLLFIAISAIFATITAFAIFLGQLAIICPDY